MICQNCMLTTADDGLFCENCGASTATEQKAIAQPKQGSDTLTIDQTGTWRWVYEMSMWSNPTILITIWKVLAIAGMVPALLVGVLSLTDGNGFGEAIGAFFQIALIVLGVMTGLLLLAYPLVAILNGGKYCVLFEMDDAGVNHIQLQPQFKRARVLAMLTVLAGAVAGNPQVTGAGILAGTKQNSYTRFNKVKSIQFAPKRNVIYLSESLNKNQVYASSADYDAIKQFILDKVKLK